MSVQIKDFCIKNNLQIENINCSHCGYVHPSVNHALYLIPNTCPICKRDITIVCIYNK